MSEWLITEPVGHFYYLLAMLLPFRQAARLPGTDCRYHASASADVRLQ